MAKKITLQHLADQAGVSRPLVSNILNGRGRASPIVRERIESLLAEHGFRPKIGRRPFYFLDRIHFRMHSQAMSMKAFGHLHEALAEQGSSIQLALLRKSAHADQSDIDYELDAMIANRPAGFVIGTSSPWTNAACKKLSDEKIPFIQLGYDTENPNYPAIVVDSFTGAQQATAYLIQQGHTRIGTLRWRASENMIINSNKKHAGYQTAMINAGLQVDQNLIKDVTALEHGTQGYSPRQALEELLQIDNPPTAVFVDNSYLSLSLLCPMAGDRGIVPEHIRQLAMIHFEDWPIHSDLVSMETNLHYPATETTVLAIDWESMSQLAVHRLMDIARGTCESTASVIRVNPILLRIQGAVRTPIVTDFSVPLSSEAQDTLPQRTSQTIA